METPPSPSTTANGTASPPSGSQAHDITIRIGIGHDHGNLYGPFNGAIDGAIDGVRYSTGARYTTAFTPDIHPDADADTIGLWNFDEGSGTSAAVAGQMSAAATLTNGATWTTGPMA
jgi:hypothetical protein